MNNFMYPDGAPDHKHTVKVLYDFMDDEEYEEKDAFYTQIDILGCPDSSLCPLFNHPFLDDSWDNGMMNRLQSEILDMHEHSSDCSVDGTRHTCVQTISDDNPVLKIGGFGDLFGVK